MLRFLLCFLALATFTASTVRDQINPKCAIHTTFHVVELTKVDVQTKNQNDVYPPSKTSTEETNISLANPDKQWTSDIASQKFAVSMDSLKDTSQKQAIPTPCTSLKGAKMGNHKRDLDEQRSTLDEPSPDPKRSEAESRPTLATPTANKQEVRSERMTGSNSPTFGSSLQARPSLSTPGPQATVYITTQLEPQASLVSFYRSREAARENLMDILIGSLIGISAAFFITFSLLIYLSVWMWRKSQHNMIQHDSYLNFFRTDPRMYMDTSPSINKSVTTEDPYYNQTMYSETAVEDLEREVEPSGAAATKYNAPSNDTILRPPRSFTRSTSWFMHRLSPTAMPHVALTPPRRGPLVNSALRISTASLRPSEASGSFLFDPGNYTMHATPIPPPAPWSRSHSQSIEILPANLSPLDSPSGRGIKSSCF
ncbi:hypothetical protein K493DRAFT_303495 [Basidiobolus meristosporus CBS 931.73]|uniref:Mid2 domain-containing protein n=1 Tax=Basidiobolus meristosporus CBS 931.73 TaxID=1314790 RepID=A0A1Y1Y2J8_9FUNG|nr:hypothetical protein K493DRAFT_303495 [Basidiobolus meristosporus CBS 931.73]|eukprot:ORX92208.1 hypothetical protein K493DRAFT_303495 [Basidiobolus meristosporus CBS 931.73]